MNQTARSLGANDSNFVTPNGLPAANHYSTARDMASSCAQALQTPGMRDILSTPHRRSSSRLSGSAQAHLAALDQPAALARRPAR